MENKELWRPLDLYINIKVSSKGRIWKCTSKCPKGRIYSEFKKDRDGYDKINVQKKDGSYTVAYVHRLVAMAFIENPESKACVNHIDCNRSNNNVSNLEWVTHRENVLHSYKFGNRKACKKVPRNTILTDFQIEQIDNLRNYYSVSQIAKLYNIEYQSLKNIIHKIKRNKRLDNQQPSIYNSIYEGSETISQESKQ